MSTDTPSRFLISFDPWYRVLSAALFLRPADSYVDVTDEAVSVRMGWAFRARFDRSAVARTRRSERTPMSRGVHGFGGRWLVNGSGEGVVVVDLEPPQRARVLGLPIRLRQLWVSVDEPDALAARLS